MWMQKHILALGLLSACGSEPKTERTPIPAKDPQAESSADASKDDGTSDGQISTGGSEERPSTVTLELCQAEHKAWRPIVDDGRLPPDCIEDLVSWCCTRSEILTRFPTVANVLEAKFKYLIDQQGHKLYHCSYNDKSRYTFHLAKISSIGTSYKVVYVNGVTPLNKPDPSQCKSVRSEDLEN